PVPETHLAEQVTGPGAGRVTAPGEGEQGQRSPLAHLGGQAHVLLDGQRGEYRGRQEGPTQPGDRTLGDRPAGDVAPAQQHPAAGRGHHAGDQVEQRRLSGPIRADDADDLAGRHAEGDAFQDLCPADAQGQVPDLQRGSGGGRSRAGMGLRGRHLPDASGGATSAAGTTSISSGFQLSPSLTSLAVYMSWMRAWSPSRIVYSPLGPSNVQPSSASIMALTSSSPSVSAWTIIWPATKPSGVKRSGVPPASSTASTIVVLISVSGAPGK